MASSTVVNYMNQDNQAGVDVICNNTRVRALSTSGTNAQGTMYMQGSGTPTAYTTGSQTMTAANLLTGIITGTPTGAVTYTTDTAAAIITAMQAASAGVSVGDYLEVLVVNDSAGANAITLAGGTGVTFNRSNNLTITQGQSFWLLFRITSLSSSTITVYN